MPVADTREFHDVLMEQALIGAVFSNPATFEQVGEFSANFFYDPAHKRIWSTIATMRMADQAASPLTVHATLASDKGLKDIGGLNYLVSLARSAPHTPNVKDYARIITELAKRRLIIAALEDGIAAAHELSFEEFPAAALGSYAEKVIDDATGNWQSESDPEAWYETASRILDKEREPDAPLLKFGIPELDGIMGGMGDGDLIIGAGRPGMGKSAFAVGVAHYAARPKVKLSLDLADDTPGDQVGVLYISLEMKRRQLIERGLSMRAYAAGHKIPYSHMRLGKVTPAQDGHLADALVKDADIPLIIDDRRGQTVASIYSGARKARAIFARQGFRLGLVVVDHLGLIDPSGIYKGNRAAEIGDMTKELKRIAGVLGIPFLVLCQIKRGVDERVDKRPFLSDLRDSGTIEQDADAVIFLHREEYYLGKQSPPTDAKKNTEYEAALLKAKNVLEILVAKNRNGPEDKAKVTCEMAYNWIGPLI